MAEIYRDSKKRKEPFKVDEFLLSFAVQDEAAGDDEEKGPNINAMRWMMEMIVTARGGKDLRKKD